MEFKESEETHSIFYRLPPEEYRVLIKMVEAYKFRSLPELCKTIVSVFSKVYGEKKRRNAIADEIEDIFKELEYGETDLVFTYEKPKRSRKQKIIEDD